MSVFANYGGNSYGGSEITIIVVIVMAVIGIGVVTWLGVRALIRSRSGGGSELRYEPSPALSSMNSAPPRRESVIVSPTSPIVVGRSAPSVDPADELAKLADLRDRGALTEAEFEAQKAKTLAAS
jgi:hypothetical protein